MVAKRREDMPHLLLDYYTVQRTLGAGEIAETNEKVSATKTVLEIETATVEAAAPSMMMMKKQKMKKTKTLELVNA